MILTARHKTMLQETPKALLTKLTIHKKRVLLSYLNKNRKHLDKIDNLRQIINKEEILLKSM